MIFALTAFVYAALHLLRPRWYVWSAALLGALFAFFTFFYLPVIEKLNVPFIYQLSIASIFLVVPELLTKSPLSLNRNRAGPRIVLGIFISLFGLMLALLDFDNIGAARSCCSCMRYYSHSTRCTANKHGWDILQPRLNPGARLRTGAFQP